MSPVRPSLIMLLRWAAALALSIAANQRASCAALPQPSHPVASHRLTVADFMGTWKIVSRTAMSDDFMPGFKKLNDSYIGKEMVFTNNSVIDESLFLMGHKITKNPTYRVEYKTLHRDTAYPHIFGGGNRYDPTHSGDFVYFKIGYFSKFDKKMDYASLQVGSENTAIPAFGLISSDGYGGAYFLRKINPKTGKFEDAPSGGAKP